MEGLIIQSDLKQVQKSPEVVCSLTEQNSKNNQLCNTTVKANLNTVLPRNILSGKVLKNLRFMLNINHIYHTCKKIKKNP